jgi:protein HIRA/HIR1
LSPRKSSRDRSWTSVGETQVLCIVAVVNSCRSWDGLTLYAVSSDGTLAAFCFEADELEGIAPHSVQQQYLQKFGFTLPPLPEGWSHTNLPVPSPEQRMTPPPSPNRSSHQLHGLNGFGAPSASTGHEVVNTLIAKRKTKRRAQLGPRGDPDSPTVLANSSTYHDSLNHMHSYIHPVAMVIGSGPVPDISQPSTSAHSLDRLSSEHTEVVTEVPIDAFGATTSTGAKQKLPLPDITEDRPTKARTLGGDRIRDNANIVKEICLPVDQRVVVSGTSEIESKNILAAPPVLTYMSLKVADAGDDIMECKNDESGGKVDLLCYLDSIDHSLMGL